MKYNVVFAVRGDWIADDLRIGMRCDADSIDELAEASYDVYKTCLRYIWKDMESAIDMTAEPNKLLTIRAWVYDSEIDPQPLKKALYEIRKKQWLNSLPMFV